MNGLGEQGFAGPGFAKQEYRDIALGREGSQLEAAIHRFAAGEQVPDLKFKKGVSRHNFPNYGRSCSRSWRIGSKAYSNGVRLPTRIWASPFMPTRKGFCSGPWRNCNSLRFAR